MEGKERKREGKEREEGREEKVGEVHVLVGKKREEREGGGRVGRSFKSHNDHMTPYFGWTLVSTRVGFSFPNGLPLNRTLFLLLTHPPLSSCFTGCYGNKKIPILCYFPQLTCFQMTLTKNNEKTGRGLQTRLH